MKLSNVRFINGGYCVQNIYMSGVPKFGFRRFYAVFVYFEHPQHGGCLIDTGYGPAVMQATRRFPWRILRWLTPMPGRQAFKQDDYLETLGFRDNEINQIFVSHFHADHIGGLNLFSKSELVYRKSSLETLESLSSYQQLSDGYIPGLLPDDLRERSRTIEESSFQLNPEFANFKTMDFWGDGSLTLIDLPGHALGHTGYLLNADDRKYLYVVDGFWDRRAMRSGRRLPRLSRRIHHNYDQYQETNDRLRAFTEESELEPIACHCPETQTYVR